jgi:hypothetical protein
MPGAAVFNQPSPAKGLKEAELGLDRVGLELFFGQSCRACVGHFPCWRIIGNAH